jgi:polysaccharide biosynthesis protein PslH
LLHSKIPGLKRKIFIILSRIPYPLEKGDKLRAFYQIRELAKQHDLVICAISDTSPHPRAQEVLENFTDDVYFFRIRKPDIWWKLALALFSATPFQVAYFYRNRIHRKINRLIALHQPDHIFCQLIRTAAYALNLDIDKTIDYQDVFSAGLQRRIKISPWYLKPLLKAEYKRVLRYEAMVFDQFDKKTIISIPDREKIHHPNKNEIVVIPNGVDTDFFRPEKKEKAFDIVFTGNMAYPPNVNGAEFLVKQIMPIVWAEKPDTRLVIAGASPAARVRELSSGKVTITGWVEDIREYYTSSRIFVAPMQIGTGLQNKVLEAMAMQLPCISSPLANKALMASEGNEILIGRNAADYAQHILSLLSDSGLRKELGQNGYKFVIQRFNWENTTSKLSKLITT